VACKECKALCLFAQEAGTKVSVAKTNLAVICNRTREAECLKSLSNVCCCCRTSLVSRLFAFLDYICNLGPGPKVANNYFCSNFSC
jgi:hypothetical protein